MLITEEKQLERYASYNRLWQGIPSIEVTSMGRIFTAFFSGGTKEQIGNYVVLLKSDNGADFSEPIAVAYKEGYRCYDPCLWIDPMGKLWFFWALQPEHAVYCSVCEAPDADKLIWSLPRKVGYDVMINKPTVLSNGDWLFPMAVWKKGVRVLFDEAFDTKSQPTGSHVFKSNDNGKTISIWGTADMYQSCYDEHMVYEKKDGSLVMLVRTYYGIGRSVSYNSGKTWTKGVDSGIGGPCSRFHVRRLRSGRLLLVNHVKYTGRNNLTAMLSEDDGETWKYSLLLDGRNDVSYPDVKEDDSGNIYIIYDRERGGFKDCMEKVYDCAREILLAKITEEDIINGKLINSDSYLRRIVNKLGKYQGENKNPFNEINRFSDEQMAKWLLDRYDNKNKVIDKVFELYPLNCSNIHQFDSKKLDKLTDKFIAGDITKLASIISLVRSFSVGEVSSKPIIDSIILFINNDISKEYSVKELADKFDMSVYYLCHLFKSVTGVSVTQYRNANRLSNAKKQLIETNKKISDIALDCGYNSYSYFSEIFAREESMTPSTFRKIHK